MNDVKNQGFLKFLSSNRVLYLSTAYVSVFQNARGLGGFDVEKSLYFLVRSPPYMLEMRGKIFKLQVQQ